MGEDESAKQEDDKFELKERFVWKWHPHGWLTLIIVVLLVFLLLKLAR